MLQRGWLLDALEEHLEGHAVVQVLAGMDLVADVDAGFVEGVEDRAPAPGQLVEGALDQAGRALRPGIEIGPGERAGEGGAAPLGRGCCEALAASCICSTAHSWRAFGLPRTAAGAKPSNASS